MNTVGRFNTSFGTRNFTADGDAKLRITSTIVIFELQLSHFAI